MAPDNIDERRKYVAELFDCITPVYFSPKEIAQKFGCSESAILNDMTIVSALRNGCTIYGLRDPDTKLIRYIGQTDGDPNYRYWRHIAQVRQGREKNVVKAEWISGLLSRELKPELVIVETCPRSQLNERERWWIKHYADAGNELVNGRLNGKRGGRPRTKTE